MDIIIVSTKNAAIVKAITISTCTASTTTRQTSYLMQGNTEVIARKLWGPIIYKILKETIQGEV